MGRQDPRDSDEQRVVENSIRLVGSRLYLVVEREQGLKPVSIRRGQELEPGLEIHDKKVMVAPRAAGRVIFPWRLWGDRNNGTGRLVRRG